jgi:hypothetical protein
LDSIEEKSYATAYTYNLLIFAQISAGLIKVSSEVEDMAKGKKEFGRSYVHKLLPNKQLSHVTCTIFFASPSVACQR